MAITFQNPLTAGTVLIRSDIRSQNFVAGSAGWCIEADGDAEFNSIIIRGGTVVSGLALYYNGPPALGNLILSIAAAAGTDSFGNAYVQGLGVYGTDGTIHALGNTLTVTGDNGSIVELYTGSAAGQASVELRPRDLLGASWDPGSIYTQLGALDRAALGITSPTESSNVGLSTIMLQGGGPTTTDTAILFSSDRFSFNNKLQLFGDIETYDNDSFDTFTPTVTNGGTATFTGATGWYQRIGKMYFVSATTTVNANGSGALNVGMTIPITMEGGSGDQVVPARFAETRLAYAILFAGADSATFSRFRIQDAGAVNDCRNLIGTDLTTGRVISLQGWVRAA